MVLEKTLENPLNCKEIQPVHPKGNQSWIFIRRTDAEAETPILWPPDVKSWLSGKDPDTGKGWRLQEKGTTEDEMVGWSTTDSVDSVDMSVSKLQQRVKDMEAWWAAVHGCKESDTSKWLNNDNNEFSWLVQSHRVSDWTRLTSNPNKIFWWKYLGSQSILWLCGDQKRHACVNLLEIYFQSNRCRFFTPVSKWGD